MSTLSRREFIRPVLAATAASAVLPWAGAMEATVKRNERVYLVKAKERKEGLLRALEMFGGLESVVGGKDVFIKVNLCLARAPETGGTCDHVVLATLIERCFAQGAKTVTVADSSAVAMATVLKVNRVHEVARTHRATFVDLATDSFRLVKTRDPLLIDGFVLSERALRAEAFINLAKLKTHDVAGVTLSMKNLMGCVLGGGEERAGGYRWHDYSDRKKMHTLGMQKALVDLNALLHPHLNIIDGFLAQEGNGPFHGETVEMRTFILGRDRVGVDATATRVMGFDPNHVGHIGDAAKRGMGLMEPKIEGDRIETLQRRFRPSAVKIPHNTGDRS